MPLQVFDYLLIKEKNFLLFLFQHSPQGEGMVEEASLGEVVPTEVEPAPLVPSPSTMAGPSPYGGPPPPPPTIAAVPYSLFAVTAPPHFHPHHQLAITAPQMYHIPTPQFQYFPSPPPPPHVYSTAIPVSRFLFFKFI